MFTPHSFSSLLNYPFSFFDLGDVDYNDPALMVAMHKHNALANLRELPLFSMDQTWTIKCATALVHWCSWQLERIEATGNPAMKLEVCAVQSKAKRWAKRCQPAKKARGRLRKREQGDKIAKLADCETLKAAARQACYSFVASLTVRTVGGMVVYLYTKVTRAQAHTVPGEACGLHCILCSGRVSGVFEARSRFV